MIKVNMHQAKTRLSELVKLIEDEGEVVVLCRNGIPVAEMKAPAPAKIDRLHTSPELKVRLAPGFDPMEEATAEDRPEEAR